MKPRCHHVPRPERIFDDEAACALCRRDIKAVTCRKCEAVLRWFCTPRKKDIKAVTCRKCEGTGVDEASGEQGVLRIGPKLPEAFS